MRERSPTGPVVTIANGSDFDDFAGIEHQPSERFRHHARGLVLRQARPAAVPDRAAAVGLDDVVVRFLGDFRSTDREWADGLRRSATGSS